MYSIGVFSRNGRSLTKNAPATLTSAVSLLVQGSPSARTLTGKRIAKRAFLRRSPSAEPELEFGSLVTEIECTGREQARSLPHSGIEEEIRAARNSLYPNELRPTNFGPKVRPGFSDKKHVQPIAHLLKAIPYFALRGWISYWRIL